MAPQPAQQYNFHLHKFLIEMLGVVATGWNCSCRSRKSLFLIQTVGWLILRVVVVGHYLQGHQKDWPDWHSLVDEKFPLVLVLVVALLVGHMSKLCKKTMPILP